MLGVAVVLVVVLLVVCAALAAALVLVRRQAAPGRGRPATPPMAGTRADPTREVSLDVRVDRPSPGALPHGSQSRSQAGAVRRASGADRREPPGAPVSRSRRG